MNWIYTAILLSSMQITSMGLHFKKIIFFFSDASPDLSYHSPVWLMGCSHKTGTKSIKQHLLFSLSGHPVYKTAIKWIQSCHKYGKMRWRSSLSGVHLLHTDTLMHGYDIGGLMQEMWTPVQPLLYFCFQYFTRWRHQMETFSVSLAFVWGIHRSLVNSPHKGKWHGVLMFSLICTWINAWVNNCEAGDLRRHHAHYDIIVMIWLHFLYCYSLCWYMNCQQVNLPSKLTPAVFFFHVGTY